ncbi:unnamed protein product, partial [Urochloa humidicola]
AALQLVVWPPRAPPRLLRLLLVVRQHSVYGLHDGEDEEHECDDKGDNRPRISQVVLQEASTPLVPPRSPISVDGAVHVVEPAAPVKHGLACQAVEHLGHRLVAAEPVPEHAGGRQQPRVRRRLDHVVHEEHVRRHLVRGGGVQLLERHEAQELVARGVVDGELRDAERASVEADVVEAPRPAPAEPDPRLVELRRRGDEFV